MGWLWRALINAAAIFVAALFLPRDWISWGNVDYGYGETGRYLSLGLTGLVLGIVNGFVKPIVSIIALPITCLTLGLFALVINGLMLLLVSAIPFLGFSVGGILPAIVAAIVIAIVSTLLSMVLPD